MREKVEQLKKHFVDHKEGYIAGTVGLLIGGAAVAAYLPTRNEISVDSKVVAFLNWKSPIENTTQVMIRRGHPGNTIMCEQTGEVFASQNHAAKIMGINPGTLSSHLSGKYDHAEGFTFTKLGESISPSQD